MELFRLSMGQILASPWSATTIAVYRYLLMPLGYAHHDSDDVFLKETLFWRV